MLTSVCWRLWLGLSLAEELFYAFHSSWIASFSLISILRGLIRPLAATSHRLTAPIDRLDLRLQGPNGLFVFKLASHIAGNIQVSWSDCILRRFWNKRLPYWALFSLPRCLWQLRSVTFQRHSEIGQQCGLSGLGPKSLPECWCNLLLRGFNSKQHFNLF